MITYVHVWYMNKHLRAWHDFDFGVRGPCLVKATTIACLGAQKLQQNGFDQLVILGEHHDQTQVRTYQQRAWAGGVGLPGFAAAWLGQVTWTHEAT